METVTVMQGPSAFTGSGRRWLWGIAMGLTVLLGTGFGCATRSKTPRFGELYNEAATRYDAERNPVIVIPGILGSKLVDRDTGIVVWGAFAGGHADPRTPRSAQLIALPMAEGVPLKDLTDHVASAGALDRLQLRLLGLPIQLRAYGYLMHALGVGGYRDEQLGLAGAVDYGDAHFTCFQFDYDWRLDLVENAKALQAFIEEKRAYVKAQLAQRFGMTDREVKFDIVAHSMGGLLARYYLMYGAAELPDEGPLPPVTWDGSRQVAQLVMVGTPNAGSVQSLRYLVEGFQLGPFGVRYAPALLGTMPSIYQLLPHPQQQVVVSAAHPKEFVDVLDPQHWEQWGWGLASPSQARVLTMLLPDVPDAAVRRRIALDHQQKCLRRAQRLFEALDRSAPPPTGVVVSLFAGDAMATDAAMSVDFTNGDLRVIRQAPGDGVVTRASALLDERRGDTWSRSLRSPIPWSRVTFLFDDHLGLTRNPTFIDNILFVLLEQS